MTTAVLAGSTGLVGSNILTLLLSNPKISATHAYSRRALPDQPSSSPSTTLTPIISSDTSTWPSLFPSSPAPQIFFSALGTTRAAAGGAAGQRKIDLDLNLSLARAAKTQGVQTCIIITSAGASSSSFFSYQKMKGELEDEVTKLGFKHTVFVRPGYIVGDRTGGRDVGVAERVLGLFERGMRSVMPSVTDGWAQEARVIARAAVRAGGICERGEREGGVWVLGVREIVGLGKGDGEEVGNGGNGRES